MDAADEAAENTPRILAARSDPVAVHHILEPSQLLVLNNHRLVTRDWSDIDLAAPSTVRRVYDAHSEVTGAVVEPTASMRERGQIAAAHSVAVRRGAPSRRDHPETV